MAIVLPGDLDVRAVEAGIFGKIDQAKAAMGGAPAAAPLACKDRAQGGG